MDAARVRRSAALVEGTVTTDEKLVSAVARLCRRPTFGAYVHASTTPPTAERNRMRAPKLMLVTRSGAALASIWRNTAIGSDPEKMKPLSLSTTANPGIPGSSTAATFCADPNELPSTLICVQRRPMYPSAHTVHLAPAQYPSVSDRKQLHWPVYCAQLPWPSQSHGMLHCVPQKPTSHSSHSAPTQCWTSLDRHSHVPFVVHSDA